jgi:hypothetical protein
LPLQHSWFLVHAAPAAAQHTPLPLHVSPEQQLPPMQLAAAGRHVLQTPPRQ